MSKLRAKSILGSLAGFFLLTPSLSFASHSSPWGYDLPVPFHALSATDKENYKGLPLQAIGTVKVDQAPFRATAVYLGGSGRFLLFGVSEHVIEKKRATAVEFSDQVGRKITIPLHGTPLSESVRGDFAIVRSSASMDPRLTFPFRSVPPVRLLFTHLSEVLRRASGPEFFVAGRASFPAAIGEMTKFPQMWRPETMSLWKSAEGEARMNLDDRADLNARQGDVLVVAKTEVLAKGLAQEMRDPDGLSIGSDLSSPFLQSRPDWAPVALAARYRSFGRMSGSPLLIRMKTGQVFMVGTHYTKGVADDVNSLLLEVERNPRRAFGRVVIKKGPQGEPMLSLLETAPFAYASAMSQVRQDLTQELRSGRISGEERKLLE